MLVACDVTFLPDSAESANEVGGFKHLLPSPSLTAGDLSSFGTFLDDSEMSEHFLSGLERWSDSGLLLEFGGDHTRASERSRGVGVTEEEHLTSPDDD